MAEIAAPSTRVVDRDPARKLGDCLAGGASWYLLVDLPGLAPVDVPRFEVPRATPGGWQSSGPSDRPTTLALGADGGGEVVVDPVVLGWPGSLA